MLIYYFFYTICLPMLQDKESEYRAAMTQLQEAERNKERISTEMGKHPAGHRHSKGRCFDSNLGLFTLIADVTPTFASI